MGSNPPFSKKPFPEIEGWTVRYVGKGIYQLLPDTAGHAITMTGSAVETKCQIAISIRFIRFEIYHNATNSWALILYGQAPGNPAKSKKFYDESALTTIQRIIRKFGEGYEYPGGILFTFSNNSTSADKVYPELYVQRID